MKTQTAPCSVRPYGGGFLLVRVAVFALTISALWIAFSFTPESPPPGLVCGVKQQFGFECPSCGITRGLTSLAHGRFRDAYHYYSPVFPVFIGILIGLIGAVLPDSVWRRIVRIRPITVTIAMAGGLTAIWILIRWLIRLRV